MYRSDTALLGVFHNLQELGRKQVRLAFALNSATRPAPVIGHDRIVQVCLADKYSQWPPVLTADASILLIPNSGDNRTAQPGVTRIVQP
jgi:hypothetical protein